MLRRAATVGSQGSARTMLTKIGMLVTVRRAEPDRLSVEALRLVSPSGIGPGKQKAPAGAGAELETNMEGLHYT
jgi:hypothetical protein